MTPMPKNLSPQKQLAWRRAMARGTGGVRSGMVARGKYAAGRDGGNAQSLSRVTRNGVA